MGNYTNVMIYICFCPISSLVKTVKTGFPELVTDNEQDLTPCYPQKNGITGEKPHYWFDLQP